MGKERSRPARVFIAVSWMWLMVGAVAALGLVGGPMYVELMPAGTPERPNLARIVLEPFVTVFVPMLLVAITLGVGVQTLKLSLPLLWRKA